MKIDRVRIDHFGTLKHFDTGPDPMGRLVVVYGPNESGKSTFFSFARSMIYGFSPASRATHPYAPWSGADIEGHIDGHLDSGAPFAVRRRLRSSPWGRAQVGDEEHELRNRTVPFAEHVPSTVFQKLFALTLDELGALDRETWGALQDRLLAAMVLDDLVPARQVVDSLRSDARSLWRPDNRGQPRDRKITAEIRELQSTRREAAERDARLRQHQKDLETSRRDYAGLRDRRSELVALLRGLERVVPASQRLRRLREAREQTSLALGTSDLPESPRDTLDRLEAELARFSREQERLQHRRRGLREEAATFQPDDRTLVGLSESLRSHQAAFERLPAAEARLEEERSLLREASTRLDEAKSGLLQPEAALDVLEEKLSALPFEALEQALAEAVVRETSLPDPSTVEERSRSWTAEPLMPALVSMVLGVILLLVSSSNGGILPAAFGGALLVFAMLALGVTWDRRRRLAGEAAQDAAALAREAGRRREQSLARARRLLEPLPLVAAAADDPELSVVNRLREVRDALVVVRNRSASVQDQSDELAALESITTPLFRAAGRSPDEGALGLFRALTEAEQRKVTHDRATEALKELEREEHDLNAEVAASRKAIELLNNRLAELGDGSVERGIDALEQWRAAERRAHDLERDFRRDFGEPDDLAGEVIAFREAHPDVELDPVSVDAVRAELDEVSRRAETEGGRIQRLEGDVHHLEGGDSPTEIDGRIAALTDQRAQLRRERDRLEMLGSIVEEAERRFREHHQPDVLERSAAYLERITDGRYRRLLPAHEGKDGVLSLETAEGRPVGLSEALSRGTKEQVLLSLRLAAADHMDAHGERLPLFVDEVFVNWDRSRRDRGLELLTQLSRSRQVFVFTCHADVAERLASLGSRIFELPTS